MGLRCYYVGPVESDTPKKGKTVVTLAKKAQSPTIYEGNAIIFGADARDAFVYTQVLKTKKLDADGTGRYYLIPQAIIEAIVAVYRTKKDHDPVNDHLDSAVALLDKWINETNAVAVKFGAKFDREKAKAEKEASNGNE